KQAKFPWSCVNVLHLFLVKVEQARHAQRLRFAAGRIEAHQTQMRLGLAALLQRSCGIQWEIEFAVLAEDGRVNVLHRIAGRRRRRDVAHRYLWKGTLFYVSNVEFHDPRM